MAARKKKLSNVLSHLVSISTIIGIPVGLYGYYASQHDKRVEKTFEFYKSYRSDTMQGHWSLLTTRWNAKAQDVRAILNQKDEEALQQLVTSLVTDAAGAKAFEQILSFFDEFAACVENSLCDGNAGVALLKEPADQFVSAYGPYIVLIRSTYKNQKFGSGAYKVRALQ